MRPALRALGLFAALYLLSALLGVWAAYDRDVAWQRFTLLAIGLALALAVAGRPAGEQALGWIGLGCALLAGALGLYFLLVYDWAAAANDKVALLQQIGLWVQASRPAIPRLASINANVAGSGLVLLLPLGAAGMAWAWRRRAWAAVALAGAALLVAGAALLLSVSRGAWLGLAAGLLAAGVLLARRRLATRPSLRRLLDLLLILGGGFAVAGLAAFWLAVTAWHSGTASWLGNIPAGNSAVSRASLWRDALAMVQDYPFTGSGLGNSMMVHASYVLLLHVGYITHLHNLYLQIAVEQGLPGLLAFLALLGLAGWATLRACQADASAALFGLPAVVALVALAAHGMVDAGAYASRMAVLLFLPIGFALAAAQVAGAKPASVDEADGAPRRRSGVLLAMAAGAAVLAAIVLLPASRAALQANLGAVAQTRAELAVYTWPEWPIQDALRRAPAVDLAPALARYAAALAEDPANAAANRRLGQIELSQGLYQQARSHLEAAYAANPGQRAARQLLGESYAIEGAIAPAAALWRSIDASQGQLQARIWWYEHIGEPQRAAWMRQAARQPAP